MIPIYVTAYTADNWCVPKRQWQMAPGGDSSLEEQHFTPPASVMRGELCILSPRSPTMSCRQQTALLWQPSSTAICLTRGSGYTSGFLCFDALLMRDRLKKRNELILPNQRV